MLHHDGYLYSKGFKDCWRYKDTDNRELFYKVKYLLAIQYGGHIHLVTKSELLTALNAGRFSYFASNVIRKYYRGIIDFAIVPGWIYFTCRTNKGFRLARISTDCTNPLNQPKLIFEPI